nr:sulfur carrier protein ThiS [Amphritea balenae]
MRLTVNGEKLQQVTARNLQELIETLRLTEKRIAVEVNQEIIPRSEHQSTRLREGDRVEIVRAVGGG